MFSRTFLFRIGYLSVVVCATMVTIGVGLLLQTKQIVYVQTEKNVSGVDASPFPVSVDAFAGTISESSDANVFYLNTYAKVEEKETWFNQATAFLATYDWYQNLASPVSRIIVIWPGERKEEIAKNVGDVLRWNVEERKRFITLIDDAPPYMSEGVYFPGEYVTHRYATPEDIALMLQQEFKSAVLNRYPSEVQAKVPLEEAIIVASLIEREASDFENMREVSGVIWNRLFIDMPLQLDATLQYVRGGNVQEPRWWPFVRPRDKYLESPFNTYQNKGLPPAPIANPSAEAILAALNPVKTDCLYYFHTKNKEYFCSLTYEEHVRKLKSLYGRGR